MSGEQPPGVVFDLPAPPAPAAEGGVWGSLREVGGWWGALRLLPSAIRQVLSSREPVGGLPVVEPGHTRPQELAEVDFNPGAPITDHTPTAETPAAEAHAAEPSGAEFTAEQALAEAATVEASADTSQSADVREAATAVVLTREAMREAWLTTHDAGTDLQDLIEAHAEMEAEQAHEAWLAAEQADYEAGTGPYAPELIGDDTGLAAGASVGEVGAELGEAGLEAGL